MDNKWRLLIIASVSALAGLLFGYDTGVINGTQIYFTQHFNLDALMQGWVVGSALIGCFFGAIFAGFISNVWGRRNSLIFAAFLFCLSAYASGLPSFLPQSAEVLVIARIVSGLAIGIASMNAPTYISEIAPVERRGRMITYYQMAIVTGFFVVFLVTYMIGSAFTKEQEIAFGWRYMFWTELVPSLIFLIALFFVPKSPRWLMLKGRQKEAIMILTMLHGDEAAQREVVEIREDIAAFHNNTGFTKGNIFAKGIFKIILIGTILSALQQFTGINAVLYYGTTIFAHALHFGASNALEEQVILAAINFAFTFVAMYTVDRIGRKPLIYIGSVGMIIGFLLLGLTLKTNHIGVLSLLGVFIFIGSFAMSMGPVVWVIIAEMFPNQIRGAGMMIAVSAQWAADWIVTQTFPVVVNSGANAAGSFWNGSLPYFIFIAFLIVIIIFTWFFIPETKGKKLEELDELWGLTKQEQK